MWLVGLLSSALDYIATELSGTKIDAVVMGGNHDRSTRKMESSRAYAVSYAYPIGFALESRFPQITWHRPMSEISVLQTADGMKVRSTHGHMFTYNKGVQGPEVSIRRALPRMDTATPADITIMGHFHQALTPGDILINGSVCGTSAWSQAQTYPHRPAEQLFFLTDEHYGLSTIHRMRLS